MVYLKSCPKCLGDLTVSQDGYGTFISCLQCGFMRDLAVRATTTAGSRAVVKDASLFAEEDRLPKAA